ncbi:response regulator transcription factor [Subsaximicrobium wynnwilliamsii]|uniref:Response regulator transcription factor n=1 Tax=Subsaximicrobium wynnwilliamsii TaxID=291179 RepID=A0A5C6ZHU7_9FLAO|nr:response regulator [Subsaximicrobium wynnwilliamsii]TXD82589.1 response regulator transcription factor [Subsaximicrobium wynnwilliamsii]TXD88232.1 response regulator transcription factor [Subsaximicrobium wynnwilliamsii]TXE02247.1 response regulator transcription factor [Subsaximicrobium wynnwilliamsii]
MKNIYILMVDDHPIIIEGYQNTLMATKNEDQTLIIDTANNCDAANVLLQKAAAEKPYDICFFDISLPPSADGEIKSGEDLAMICRDLMPNTKVVVLTMFNESYRIYSIVKDIKPDGFLIKSDLTSMELAEAFQVILTNPPYYSTTVNNVLKTSVIDKTYIDEHNRKILFLLSQGVKTKNLVEHLDLSLSAIEKRKKQLKMLFSVSDARDETLIEAARAKGFI